MRGFLDACANKREVRELFSFGSQIIEWGLEWGLWAAMIATAGGDIFEWLAMRIADHFRARGFDRIAFESAYRDARVNEILQKIRRLRDYFRTARQKKEKFKESLQQSNKIISEIISGNLDPYEAKYPDEDGFRVLVDKQNRFVEVEGYFRDCFNDTDTKEYFEDGKRIEETTKKDNYTTSTFLFRFAGENDYVGVARGIFSELQSLLQSVSARQYVLEHRRSVAISASLSNIPIFMCSIGEDYILIRGQAIVESEEVHIKVYPTVTVYYSQAYSDLFNSLKQCNFVKKRYHTNRVVLDPGKFKEFYIHYRKTAAARKELAYRREEFGIDYDSFSWDYRVDRGNATSFSFSMSYSPHIQAFVISQATEKHSYSAFGNLAHLRQQSSSYIRVVRYVLHLAQDGYKLRVFAPHKPRRRKRKVIC